MISKWYFWIIVLLLLAQAGKVESQINEALGTLSPGKSVTITFEVVISSSLPVSVTQISAQGSVSGSNFTTVNTDDPETVPSNNDATVTRLSQNFDYGDAPDPLFPTLLANNGARHFIPGSGAVLYLGSLPPDADEEGQPDSTSTGDDNHNTDDEDGVALPAILPSSQNISVTVTASQAGYLNAWIDYQRNGSWADPGDQVFVNQSLVSGPNVLSLTTPAISSGGSTFARFRFSSQQDLTPTGLAPDGEVEDFQVTLNSPPVISPYTAYRYPSQSLKVPVSTLLAQVSDADGDSIVLDSISSFLPNGASVVRQGGWIYYSLPADNFNPGSFDFTVTDGRGAFAQGTVTVAIMDDQNQTRNWSMVSLGGGDYRLSFNGIPGRTYRIQYTEALNPPNTAWTTLDTQTADATGQFHVIDHPGPLNRFYRTVSP